MATAAQIAANQQNAELSTGPTSADGKAKTSKNALKTGLTGHTVLLPTDDAALYGKHVETYRSRYQPEGEQETELVQSIADTAWRLARIPSLEASIYAVGRVKFADLYPQEEEAKRSQLIQAEIFIAYERQLRGLATQEARLRRQQEKDQAALHEIQQKRQQEHRARLTNAAKTYIAAVEAGENENFDLGQFGFEFSMGDIEVKALELKPDLFNAWWAEQPEFKAELRKQTMAA